MKEAVDWREKYLTAVDRLEAEGRSWTQVDDVLRRLIKRLCIAARGMDSAFDDELTRLSGAMRTTGTPEALETLLGRLTTAVAALDAARAHAAALPATQTGTPGAPAPASASASVQAPDAGPHRSLAEPLILIADRLRVEDTEQRELAAVRAALATPAAGAEFESALWQLGDLVAAERQRLEREKFETEELLKQVTSRLGEFANFLTADDADRNDADRSGRELNDQVLGEVQEIGNTLQLGLGLDLLQKTVKARLEAIDAHLRAFRTREGERARIYRERAERMRERVTQLERETAALAKSLAREQRIAMQDGLTGIANRLAYDERIAQELKRWRRFQQPLSLVAWDLDHFKRLNDGYGHRAGDRVLRAFATVLREKVRETDFVARYGGEEFVMLLVGTSAADAKTVAEAIRAEIARLGFHFRGEPVAVTASCGIAEAREGDTPERLFDRADKALYRAKEAGRDRCIVA